jgi:hypothetical protein
MTASAPGPTGRHTPGPAGRGFHLNDIAASDAWYEHVAARVPVWDDPLAAALVHQLNRIDEELLPSAPVASIPPFEAVRPFGAVRPFAATRPFTAIPPFVAMPPAEAPVRPRPPGVDPIRAGLTPVGPTAIGPTAIGPTAVGPTRARRVSKRVLIPALAALLLSSASAGVAAADAGSPLYPLHLVLFGDTQPDQTELDRANALLDQAAIIVSRGQERHGLTSGELSSARHLLAESSGVFSPLPASARRTQLISRHGDLSQGVERLAGLRPEPSSSTDAGNVDPSSPAAGEENQSGQGADRPPTTQPGQDSKDAPAGGTKQTD